MNDRALTSRIERLKRFIDLEAPAFVLAHAYHLALEMAESLNSPRLNDVQAMGKKLSNPEFDKYLADLVRESNLEAAGFCTAPIFDEAAHRTRLCLEPALKDETLCLTCFAAFEEEVKAEQEYDASPEGKKEIAEWEAAQREEDDD